MNVSFNKLWKLLIDKNTTRTKLRTEAKVSSNAMAKLGKNESFRYGGGKPRLCGSYYWV